MRVQAFSGGYIQNGEGFGEVGQRLASVGFDDGFMRPFFDDDGTECVQIKTGKMVVRNGEYVPEEVVVPIEELMTNRQRRRRMTLTLNDTTLRKEEYIHFDRKVLMATRTRLQAWTDLASRNRVGGFNAFAKTTFEYEAMSDPGEAVVSMSGVIDGRQDMPKFALSSVPLAITSSKFVVDLRKLEESRNLGMPISTTMPEACGRRIAEMIEKMLLGTVTGLHYGTVSSGPTAHRDNSQIYGYTNFPSRQTKTDLATPTGSNPQATLDDVLEMRDLMYDAGFYGPFMLYHSTDWDQYMDDDYGQIGTGSSYGFAPSKTLRQRLREIEGIQDVKRLDQLLESSNPFTLIMIQMTSEVAEAIDGVQPRTIQWETHGGWLQHFMIYGIQVPLLKYDYNGNCGIVHATTS